MCNSISSRSSTTCSTSSSSDGMVHKRIAQSNNKRVRFCPQVFVRTTLHANDMADEEYHAYWYCPAEMRRIRAINLKAVQLMEEGRIRSQRGLEGHVQDAHAARQWTKQRVRDSVLQAQERGEVSSTMARLSMEASLDSRMQALVLGMADAMWVAKQQQSVKEEGTTPCTKASGVRVVPVYPGSDASKNARPVPCMP